MLAIGSCAKLRFWILWSWSLVIWIKSLWFVIKSGIPLWLRFKLLPIVAVTFHNRLAICSIESLHTRSSFRSNWSSFLCFWFNRSRLRSIIWIAIGIWVPCGSVIFKASKKFRNFYFWLFLRWHLFMMLGSPLLFSLTNSKLSLIVIVLRWLIHRLLLLVSSMRIIHIKTSTSMLIFTWHYVAILFRSIRIKTLVSCLISLWVLIRTSIRILFWITVACSITKVPFLWYKVIKWGSWACSVFILLLTISTTVLGIASLCLRFWSFIWRIRSKTSNFSSYSSWVSHSLWSFSFFSNLFGSFHLSLFLGCPILSISWGFSSFYITHFTFSNFKFINLNIIKLLL